MADYATVNELASYMRITDDADDDQLALAISAASRVIDRYINQSFEADAIPDAVKAACLIQASRFFTRRYAPFGVAGSPDSGSEIRLLAKVDADVAVILGPFITWWGAV
jgi:hypothetical protein